MAPESASHGDFTQRFATRYEEWINFEDISKSQTMEQDRVETESSLPDNKIFGFQNEIKSLENFLLDQKVYKEFKSLVVVGEYGVGKTTLCKMIFNNDNVRSVYAPRIWVSMQGEDNKISVVKRILKSLGVEDSMLESIHREVIEDAAAKEEAGEINEETANEKELSALLYALHLNLRWKKYLIVFDDIREEDNWNEKLGVEQLEGAKWGKYLADGFFKGSGGRVIYTTRDETLAKKLVGEEHEIHRLWPLSDSVSVWKIYEAEVFEKRKEAPRNDKKCIDELMNKSRGLPLAVRLLAELDPVFLDDELVSKEDSLQEPTDLDNNIINSSPPDSTKPSR